jgi:hypothetical protein
VFNDIKANFTAEKPTPTPLPEPESPPHSANIKISEYIPPSLGQEKWYYWNLESDIRKSDISLTGTGNWN